MTKTQQKGKLMLKEEIAPGVFWMSIQAPDIAAAAKAGQFVHIRVMGPSVQFLRMPFAIYDAAPQMASFEICFQVVGEGTEQLSQAEPGDYFDCVGPLGNGWSIPATAKHALLISGGLGAAPLKMLGRALSVQGTKTDVVMGASTAKQLVCRDRLASHAMISRGTLQVATDDGTEGVHGFCTEISDALLDAPDADYDYVCICGPAPMEANAVKPALAHGIDCEVSLERLMACGIGVCLSCVVETVDGRKRCCVDGPVFKAAEVQW